MKQKKEKKEKKPKIALGTSRAVGLSILIHAGLFLLAGSLVVFTVVKKKEVEFAPPKAVERPKMKIKKPKVRVKKSAKPKPTSRIVTKMKSAKMPDIQLPEMSGMGEGLDTGLGGFDMMPDLSDVSVFGAHQSIGNDFEGTFYDLKRDRNGNKVPMDKNQFRDTIDRFVLGGWKESYLSRYYRAPEKLYTTHFVIPPIPSPGAPDVYGAPETESYFFFVKYKGQLVYPEDIKFRFWGIGDGYCIVRVDGKLVLIAAWPIHTNAGYFNMWQSSSSKSHQYQLANQMMTVGDWIELKAGEPVDMEVLYGEWMGGDLACILLVEVAGEKYPTSSRQGPLLPAFKTEEFTRDQLDAIWEYLPPDECSLTNGPIFRDFKLPPNTETNNTVATEEENLDTPAPEKAANSSEKMREWTMADGRTVTAELVTHIGSNVTLKNKRGKTFNIPQEQLSEKDQQFIQLAIPPKLDINFSKSSKLRVLPFTQSKPEDIPNISIYTFSTTIKKTSTKPYNHKLTAEFFAIGQEVNNATYILLDYQKEEFILDKKTNENQFSFSGRPVEISDYVMGKTGQHRGDKYKGYLVVVTDSRGKIIAHKASSEKFFDMLDNLRKVPVGRHFDDNGNRVPPSRPRPFAAPKK